MADESAPPSVVRCPERFRLRELVFDCGDPANEGGCKVSVRVAPAGKIGFLVEISAHRPGFRGLGARMSFEIPTPTSADLASRVATIRYGNIGIIEFGALVLDRCRVAMTPAEIEYLVKAAAGLSYSYSPEMKTGDRA